MVIVMNKDPNIANEPIYGDNTPSQQLQASKQMAQILDKRLGQIVDMLERIARNTGK